MRYIRNSGRKKPVKQKTKTKNKVWEKSTHLKKDKREVVITEDMKDKIAEQAVSDARFIKMLSYEKRFSKEWIQEILLEILMQCMGKKDILTTNMFGTQIVARMFKEKGAIQVASILAKMEGHLFDTVKGSLKAEGKIEHQHTIELIPDANRTVEVFKILESCGALKSPTEQISHTPLESVHTA